MFVRDEVVDHLKTKEATSHSTEKRESVNTEQFLQGMVMLSISSAPSPTTSAIASHSSAASTPTNDSSMETSVASLTLSNGSTTMDSEEISSEAEDNYISLNPSSSGGKIYFLS
jgi:hypothetical protein